MGIGGWIDKFKAQRCIGERTRKSRRERGKFEVAGDQGCTLSPCLFKFYVEYIMRNAGLDEAQARIKIAERNINNLRYAEDTTHPCGRKRTIVGEGESETSGESSIDIYTLLLLSCFSCV